MKVSVNWLKQFTEVSLPIDELVDKIGAQLGAVEEVVDFGKKYEGIVVAKVVECSKHTGADKLSVCKVDDGGVVRDVGRDQNGHVEVVCGAPNVREGLTVAWLPPGTTVPVTADKDPLVLAAREIRGVISNGMLASASELAISDDHSGIIELDGDLKAGTNFAEAHELNDYIIDIENKMFTHRPDCFGILGIAREIAGIQGNKFESPQWYKEPLGRIRPGKIKLPLEVRNEATKLVPRFTAIAVSGIKVKPSPFIMQTYLARVGLKPINSIVDITNYIMMLTGQPLHAYDYDKLKSLDGVDKATLVARMPSKGEELTLLGGKKVQPLASDIVIASANKLVGMGGVMGGSETEVDANTTNIVLECANFDMYAIRKTSMAHGLFTDAVTRFNKGQSPLQNERVFEEAVAMIESLSGGLVASKLFDEMGNLSKPIAVHVRDDFINLRLGITHTAKDMAERLENVEFEARVNGPTLAVTPPFWRTDIEIPEDVVEEVGRLFGYENLPLELPKKPAAPARPDPVFGLKSDIRTQLAKLGANEVLTYSFVHGNLFDKASQDKENAFRLSNALSPDLQFYRISVTPSLLEKVHPNIKAGFGEFALFEIGKVHFKGEMDKKQDIPTEYSQLSLVFAADEKAAKTRYGGAPFYMAKYYLGKITDVDGFEIAALGDFDFGSHKWTAEMCAPYDAERSIVLVKDKQAVGVVGEFKPEVKRKFKLPDYSAGFEIFVGVAAKTAPIYQPISKFPKVSQDVSLKVASDTQYSEVYNFVFSNLAAPENTSWQLEPVDVYQKAKDKHITLRLTIASHAKTMTDQEVNRLLNEVSEKAKAKLGAKRI